jgi:hypothetical protein
MVVADALEVVLNVISTELDVLVVVAELVLELLWAVVAVKIFQWRRC